MLKLPRIFRSKVISYSELLEVFWTTHDPTTLNRQGADVGTQFTGLQFSMSMRRKKPKLKNPKGSCASNLRKVL